MRADFRSLVLSVAMVPLCVSAVVGQRESLHRFVQGGKYGFKDNDGLVKIQPLYDNASGFDDGLAPVALLSRESEVYDRGKYGSECFVPALTWGYIDAAGRTAIPHQYAEANPFSEGRAAVRVGELWGYIDAAGRTAIPHKYAEAKPFSEGRAAVRAGELWGYIDTDGRWTIQPAYDDAGSFENGIAKVSRGPRGSDSIEYITPTGQPASPQRENEVPPFSLTQRDGVRIAVRYYPARSAVYTYTMTDRTGKVIVQRDDGLNFLGEGLIAYGGSSGPLGLMDTGGRTITSQEFEAVKPYSNGLAAIKVKGVWGFIDRFGKAVIAPSDFVHVGAFHDGLAEACVRAGDEQRCGFIDTSGKLVISARFASAGPFLDGWAGVTEPLFGRLLRINRKGMIVHRESYDYPQRTPFGKCQFPPPAPAPRRVDYALAISLRTSPPGASVYLVPLWDWQSHTDGKQLLENPDLLDLYLVTGGTTPLDLLDLKMQVYMAVFELGGQRKVSRLVVSPNGPRQLEMRF